jgi:nucleoside 2-deoxyribosyltransferase
MKITICASAKFAKEMVQAKKILENKGYEVLLPEMAESFATGKINLDDFKGGRTDANFKKKYDLVRKHFEEVAKGDMVLVLNYDRDETNKNYIGGNTFAEMAIAFYLKKPIYLLKPVPEYSSYCEEIKSMDPIILDGDLEKIRPE